MGAYEKWKKLLFGALTSNSEVRGWSQSGQTYYERHSKDWKVCGICSLDCKFSQEITPSRFEISHHAYEDLPGSTFRTSYIYNGECTENYEYEGMDNLIVGIFIKIHECTDYSLCVITTEGIMCAEEHAKKKLFFRTDDSEKSISFSTYRELLTEGYSIDGGKNTIELCTHIDDSNLFARECKITTYISSISPMLNDIIPKLIACYKSNEELYEDALDELMERFPRVQGASGKRLGSGVGKAFRALVRK